MGIFISHSTKAYGGIVSPFMEMLQLGAGVAGGSIFCTSKPDTVKNGQFFVQRILEELNKSKVVIAIVSRGYLRSDFCIEELGAAQTMNVLKPETLKTFLVPPIDYKDVDAVMIGTQAGKIDSGTDLDHLYDYLKHVGLATPMTANWSTYKDQFLSKIGVTIKDIRLADQLSRVRIQYVLFERSDKPDVTYKLKLRAELWNGSDHDLIVKKPTWSATADQVHCRPKEWSGIFPGQLAQPWIEHRDELLVKKGDHFIVWMALDPNLADAVYHRRHEIRDLGKLRFAVSVNGEDATIEREV